MFIISILEKRYRINHLTNVFGIAGLNQSHCFIVCGIEQRQSITLFQFKINDRETKFYAAALQSTLTGGIMFIAVRPSVRPLPSLCRRYFENRWNDFDANWHKCISPVKWSTWWVMSQEVKGHSSRSHEAEVTFRNLAEASLFHDLLLSLSQQW